MTQLFRLALLGVAVAFAVPGLAAEPLPKGAKARLGTTVLRDPTTWNGAILLADGKHLAAHSAKGLVKIDAATGEVAGTLSEKGGGFDRRILLSRDASRALSLTFSTASVWDVASGKTLADVKRTIPYGDTAAALTPDGKFFALGGAADFNAKDKPVTAIVWDVEKNAKLAEVQVMQNQMAHVALSPNGKLLATWGSHFERNPPKEGLEPGKDPGRIVQIWDTASGKELAKATANGFGVRLLFSPDGQMLAIASGSGSIRLVDPKTGADRRLLFARSDQGVRMAFSADGKSFASGGGDGAIQLWSRADGKQLGTILCPIGALASGIRGIEFLAADRAVVWAVVGFTAVVWEVPSGKLISPLSGNVGPVVSVRFQGEGKEILTGDTFGQIIRWGQDGKELGAARLRNAGSYGLLSRYATTNVLLSPDGKKAISEQNSGAVYDAATGLQTAMFQGVGNDTHAYICRDAHTVLLIPNTGFPPKPQLKTLKIAVWDSASGNPLGTIETPNGDILHADVTPDGSKLATVLHSRSMDGKSTFYVIGWDLMTGKKLGEFSEPGGFSSTSLAMAPDNATVVVSTPGGKLLGISLADGKVAKEIDVARRGLSAPPVFSPDGKLLAFATTAGFGPQAHGAITIVDWSTGKPAGGFKGHSAPIACLAFAPDGKTLASGSYDTTVLLWDVDKAAKE